MHQIDEVGLLSQIPHFQAEVERLRSALEKAKVTLCEIADASGFVQGNHLTVSNAMRARAQMALDTINQVLGE